MVRALRAERRNLVETNLHALLHECEKNGYVAEEVRAPLI
jgi:hypothetical protein